MKPTVASNQSERIIKKVQIV